MTPRARTVAPALAALLLAGCTDGPTAMLGAAGRAAETLGLAPAPSTGTALVFLSPLGPALPYATPAYTGAFDGGRSPEVQVCRVAAAAAPACDGEPVARYTRTEGTGGAVVTVSTDQQLYAVNWAVAGLPAGSTYRVRVLDGGAELGRAHARVPAAGETATQLRAAGLVPVGNGTRLPIRFRLETAAAYLPGTPDAPATVLDQEYRPRRADFTAAHPEMPGARVSFNTLMLSLQPTATTAEVNALVASIRAERVGGIPGVAGRAGGILFLRVPATTHAEMEALLAALRIDPRVKAAAQDALAGRQVTTRESGDQAAAWAWSLNPDGGNWGFELSRVPQMWNLNAAMKKVGLDARARAMAILESGFAAGHPDLAFFGREGGAREDDHGTMVAGVAGARHDNGLGVDGVDPFARMIGVSAGLAFTGEEMEWRTSAGQTMIQAVGRLILVHPEARVINLSQGYNWSHAEPAPISTTNAAVRRMVDGQGAVARDMLAAMAELARGNLPVIVQSAGNDSDAGLGTQDARYGSPLANAALAHGAANVIVVEAVALAGAPGAWGARRAAFSNVGGHVSAPGAGVLVPTVDTAGAPRYTYRSADGTSLSAPFVAGLASYLYTLAPDMRMATLTTNPIRDLLRSSAVEAGTASPRVDAFSAALGVDAVMGGARVLRMLLDVDDGTPDGNTRADAEGHDVTTEDADGDGGPGDGRIDMADFRRFRDALLQVEGGERVSLDGSLRHPKKDLNGNGRTAGEGDDENVFPRFDFNGDGRLSRDAKVQVAGVMRGAEATDLDVLRRLFSDPDVSERELPGLLESTDIHVDAGACLAVPGAVSVRARAYPVADATPLAPWRTFSRDTARRVYTVPRAAGAHRVAVEAVDAAGQVVGRARRDFDTPADGADLHWTACGGVMVTPKTATLDANESLTFTATENGDRTTRVAWSATGGTIGADGRYVATGGAGTYLVVARSVADPSASDTATVTVRPRAGARVTFLAQRSFVTAGSSGTDGDREISQFDSAGTDPQKPHSFGGSASAATQGRKERYYPEYDWTAWVEGRASVTASGSTVVSVGEGGAATRYVASGKVRIGTTLTNNSMHWMPSAGWSAAGRASSEVSFTFHEPTLVRAQVGCGEQQGGVWVGRAGSDWTVASFGCGSDPVVLPAGTYRFASGAMLEKGARGGQAGHGGSWSFDYESGFDVSVTFEPAPEGTLRAARASASAGLLAGPGAARRLVAPPRRPATRRGG
jgi:hypothetical protein